MRTRHSIDPCADPIARWWPMGAPELPDTKPRFDFRRLVVAVALAVAAGTSIAESTRISPGVLPEALRQKWNELRPSFNEHSRCAAVWDWSGDADKQLLRCSIYMRMGAEAERRAMAACEEFRAEHKIRAPCRLVVP